MEFRVPTLELKEPLRSRPLFGGTLGAATGLLFGTLSMGKAFATPWQDQVLGFVIGGMIVGAIIGALLPCFRRRWLASVIVGTAAATGLAVAAPFWDSPVFRELSVFFGVVYGLIYGVLFWRYQPDAPESQDDADER
jgi:hypothetical protein